MTNAKKHSLRNFSISAEKIPLAYSGEGEMLTGTPAPEATVKITSGGRPIVSPVLDKSMPITIRAHGVDDVHQVMLALLERQRLGFESFGNNYIGFEFTIRDENSGVTWSTKTAVITQAPGPSVANEAALQDWAVTMTDVTTRMPTGAAAEAFSAAKRLLAAVPAI